MFKSVPSARTNIQKNYQCSISSVRPNCHKPMLADGFLGILISIFHQLSRHKCTRKNPRKNLPPTSRACGQVGNLKHLCPNVRRYKLLMFNYLQMFSRFPSAETKVQKNYQSSITSVSPNCHKPMLGAVIFPQLSMVGFISNTCQALSFHILDSFRKGFSKVHYVPLHK